MNVNREWFEKNYYELLGVSDTATQQEITKAYRKLARRFHPDANPGDAGAEERFKEVSAAYEVVGDAEKRKEYDEVRRMGPMAGMFGGGSPGGPGGPGGGGGFSFDPSDLSDLIGNLFTRGRGGPGGDAGAGTDTRRGPRRGADIETDLHLSFDEAARGVTSTVNLVTDVRCPDCFGSGAAAGTAPRACSICHGRGAVDENQGYFSFSRPCTACNGKGRIIDTPCPTCNAAGSVRRARQVRVRIPEGVRDGQRIRVKGKGAAGAGGGPDGDLYVSVHVADHPLFGRSGDHLTITVPITFPEAALGGDIKVPTLEGEPVVIRVPPGTRSGRTFRVRGRGLTSAKASGDLLVTVEVAVPTQLSAAERKAIEALAAAAEASPRDHLGV